MWTTVKNSKDAFLNPEINNRINKDKSERVKGKRSCSVSSAGRWEEELLPDGRGGAAVHLSVQDDLVLLQLQDDLVDASDHPVDSLGQTLAGLGLLQRPLLASFRQLLLYLLQILKNTGQNCELR